MAPQRHACPVGTADCGPRQCHHQAQGAVDDVGIGGDGCDPPDLRRQVVRLGPVVGDLDRLLCAEATRGGSGFSSRTTSAMPVMSSMRRTIAEGERMVSVPPERLRRDARAAITPSPQPLIKSNSARSNTTDRCRSMTASKIAPSSGALTRSASPRIATTARAFTKPTVTANCPRGSLAVVTSASHPLAARSGASLLATTKGSWQRMGHPPKCQGRCRHATLRTLRATARDSTRSRCLRMAADHSGRPRRPSLSKVRLTLHLSSQVDKGDSLVIFVTRCCELGERRLSEAPWTQLSTRPAPSRTPPSRRRSPLPKSPGPCSWPAASRTSWRGQLTSPSSPSRPASSPAPSSSRETRSRLGRAQIRSWPRSMPFS